MNQYKKARLFDKNGDLSKRWYVGYYYKHPETHKFKLFQHFISLKLHTKIDRFNKASELIKKYNRELNQGWNPFSTTKSKPSTNVTDAINYVLKVKSSILRNRTTQTYNSIARIFLNYLDSRNLTSMEVGDVNYTIVQDFFDYSLEFDKIGSRTYNNRITNLKIIFNFLLKREYVLINPVNNIERLKESEPEITAFDKLELQKIKKELPVYNYNLYVISQLIFYCFLRPAEIVRLQYKDIVWDHEIIILPGTKSKNRKSEVINIPDQMIINLKNWNLNFEKELFIFSTGLKPGKKQIAPTRIAEVWKVFADKHRIKKGIYNMKHTSNGLAFYNGIPSRDIQLHNRHSSLEQTEQYLNRFSKVASEKIKKGLSGY